MARTDYSPETKAAAMAALLTGQSIGSVAKEYEIPRSTVGNWSSQVRREGTVPDTKKEEIGDLLASYLEENLRSLRSQAEVFGKARWLEKQSASELAVLHGVQTDKAIRLLEAMSRAGDGDAA
ncbi:MAG: hypothetical protein M3Q49_08195 [Actinomycetota bacterium]|nr:hypothetical protein [Actinomycetota bacterium]